MLDEIRLRGENKELKDEVIRLSKEYGIVTPYTSYLVVEDGELPRVTRAQPAPMVDVDGRGARRFLGESRRRPAVRQSAGGKGTAAPAKVAAAMGRPMSARQKVERDSLGWKRRDAFKASAGRQAIAVSEKIAELKRAEAEAVEGQVRFAVRMVAGREFRLVGAVWTEAAIKPDMKVVEIEYGSDAYFAIFAFTHNRSAVIISRNQKDSIELDQIMGAFGGGGHQKAASATIKEVVGVEVYEKLLAFLESSLRPAITAGDLMGRDVTVIAPDISLLDAAIFLEGINHTGCPVVDEEGKLVGLITLRDIMKGRRSGQMHAPVKAYMTRKVISTHPGTTFREMEDILLTNNIGHLPILEDGKLVGIITRTDYLAFRRAEKEKVAALTEGLL